ncbi:(2Fe-2S)-binding domain protein [Desulforamulus reducens MI-1]|uniref:(2Fe-2S)-binding domain protein n=1 Tax=Desulforamulus reducens (strain ATCC BAA-1160 / DSM 100696 / MI-1) TaxID=349161 RepID=A4J4N0_DESRM|nr:(2Fe-2S)-binding protein [Desulforamulus reducens]ABO50033.1 (2Fe-2S)-binding domain protein [Desulforamulus reducens MI-1]
MKKKVLNFKLNGDPMELLVSPEDTLLDVLRDQLGLTGTKKGCGKGECGACTVIMNGKSVNSCIVPALQAMDSEVETIEGIGTSEKLHPLQETFIDHGAIQCGFCTPGMIMSAKALLDQNLAPTRTEIKEAIAGNICRCTGYVKIEEAVQSAAEIMKNNKEQ